MKTISITILAILVISCKSSRTELTKEEFEAKIISIENFNPGTKKLANGWYETTKSENDFKRIDQRTSTSYFINPKPLILPENFSKGDEFENYEGHKGLTVYFDEIGMEIWSKATDANTGSHLIFILDNEILTAQYVNSQITNGASAFWQNDLTESDWNQVKGMIAN